MLVNQLCLTLCNPMDCSPPGSSMHGILRIFQTQGSNLGLLHCRKILYHLSYQTIHMHILMYFLINKAFLTDLISNWNRIRWEWVVCKVSSTLYQYQLPYITLQMFIFQGYTFGLFSRQKSLSNMRNIGQLFWRGMWKSSQFILIQKHSKSPVFHDCFSLLNA